MRRTERVLWFLIFGAVVFAGWYYLTSIPQPERYSLKMTAGSASDLRHFRAEILAEFAAEKQVKLQIFPTKGSQEAIDAITERKLDLALVQGGLQVAPESPVRQVARLQLEPLHMLVKKELADQVREQGFEILAQKSINVSSYGSGTYLLSLEVLRFMGLKPGADRGLVPKPEDPFLYFRINELSKKELLLATDPAQLPDAIFVISAPPSRVVKHLVQRWNYRLVPLEFASALALSAVEEWENLQVAVQASKPKPTGTMQTISNKGNVGVDRTHVYATTIPPYTYDVEPPVPEQPLPTIGTSLLLIAHRDASPVAVERLVETIYESGFAKSSDPPLTDDLLELPPEFPWHEGTLNYRIHHRPLIADDLIELAEKFITIVVPVLGGLLFLSRWLGSKFQLQNAQSFQSYISTAAKIEQEALGLENEPHLQLNRLWELRQQLTQLKNEAMERFCDGSLQGETLLASFLIHVHDVRNYLTALMMHERNNLEDRALLDLPVDQRARTQLEKLWHQSQLAEKAQDKPAAPVPTLVASDP